MTWARVLRRTVTQLSDENYEIAVELAPDPSWEAFGSCSYVAPVYLGNSSLDVLGGAVSYLGGYVAGSPVYPSTATIISGASTAGTQPLILYGTPNNGSGWGINSGVGGAGPRNTVRWAWDLAAAGSPRICRVEIITYAGDFVDTLFVQASDDGTSWTTIQAVGATGGGVFSIAFSGSNHRYWGLLYDAPTPGGYYPGLDMTAVMLWGGSLA